MATAHADAALSSDALASEPSVEDATPSPPLSDPTVPRSVPPVVAMSAAAPALTPADASAMLASFLPKDVDPTKCQLAYGRRAIPKLIGQLDETKLITRQRALVFLAELFHSPENVAQAIECGITNIFLGLLDTKDLTTKQKVTEAFTIIAGHAIGRADIVHQNALPALAKLFDEINDLVRKHVHDTFSKVTMQREGVKSLMASNLFVAIINRLPEERMHIQVQMLETCYNCIRMGSLPYIPQVALGCPAMEVFTELVRKSLVSEVKVAACRCIMMLSFFHEGKILATQSDTVLVLIALLNDRKSDVRAASAGALMSITIDCDAKRIMVRENALTVLMDLLADSDDLVLLNVIKTITNCAEDYRGRFQLHHCVRKLDSLTKSKNAHVAEAARQAIAVINWRP